MNVIPRHLLHIAVLLRDRKGDTRGSMFVTLTTCLLLVTVLSPVVEGDCTVVVNGAGGAVYTRWGRTVCPQGAALVYTGRAAGTKYNVKGGTSDTLCMPETPQYLSTDTTATHVALLRGVELKHLGRQQHHLTMFYRPTSLVPSATPTPSCLFSLSLLSTPVLTGGAWSITAT